MGSLKLLSSSSVYASQLHSSGFHITRICSTLSQHLVALTDLWVFGSDSNVRDSRMFYFFLGVKSCSMIQFLEMFFDSEKICWM